MWPGGGETRGSRQEDVGPRRHVTEMAQYRGLPFLTLIKAPVRAACLGERAKWLARHPEEERRVGKLQLKSWEDIYESVAVLCPQPTLQNEKAPQEPHALPYPNPLGLSRSSETAHRTEAQAGCHNYPPGLHYPFPRL